MNQSSNYRRPESKKGDLEMNVLRLIRIDFDSQENEIGSAIVSKHLGTFGSGADFSAEIKVRRFLEDQPPVKMYSAWNGKVYPQYEIVVETVQ